MLVLLAIGLIAATGVSLAMLPHRAEAPPEPPIKEVSAQPAQIAVVDGGTLRLRDRVVLLQGVAPPARGTMCRGSDGSSEDCAAAATNALAALVRGTPVACRVTGADELGRPYAICRAGAVELNRAMAPDRASRG